MSFQENKKTSSYSWHPTPHQSTSLQCRAPPTPFPSVHTLPASSLSHAPPGNIHTCTWVPSAISSPCVIFSCWWTICSPHCFNGQESWMQAVFSQSFFSWSHLSLGGNRYLALLSNQILSNCNFHLYASDSLTQSTALLQPWLFPDSSWCGMREQRLCWCVLTLCVCSVVQQFSSL